MKRFLLNVFALFVAFCIALPVFAFDALPEDFSLLDLSDMGISPFYCERADAVPIINGSISSGEYSSFITTKKDTGLTVSSNQSDRSDLPVQESSILTDGKYFYVAVSITAPSEYSFLSYHKKLGEVYAFSLDFGMTPGDHPMQRGSVLHNEYYFDALSFDCLAVSGYRVYHTKENGAKYPLRISNLTAMYQDNGYRDDDGLKWTADFYGGNAAFSLFPSSDKTVYIVELKIPVGDVLLSVLPEDRTAVLDQFLNQNGVLCGGFSTKFSDSSGASQIVLGLPANSSCPLISDGKTWDDILKEKYRNSGFAWGTIDVFPLPLYLVGKPSAGNEESSAPTVDFVPEKEENIKQNLTEVPVQTTSGENISQTTEKVPLQGDFSEGENLLTEREENENLFENLPDEGDALPEDTERIDLDPEDSEESGKGNSLLGQILLFATGLLLFVSIIIFAIVSGRKESPSEEKKGRDGNTRKKTQEKNNKIGKKS